ncbi:MAG TPA: TonB family protein [Gemmatimonadaceae bacterium]|nr:TonB family protein [Gemmatimonadaceae bacterium]
MSASSDRNLGVEIRAIDHRGPVVVAGTCPRTLLAWADSAAALLASPQSPGARDVVEDKTPEDVQGIGTFYLERTTSGTSTNTSLIFHERPARVVLVPVTPVEAQRFVDAIREASREQMQMTGGACRVATGSVTDPATASQRTYFEFQVERQAMSIPGNPAPAYPDLLKSAGVAGEVLAQFVVDTAGHVDMSTIKMLKSTHALFSQAVRDVLARTTFTPAQIGGRSVKQLVQMPFQFTP